jgi:hypothetical protein
MTLVGEGREIKEYHVGFRVYSDTGAKDDKHGKFDGFSDKFDQWIPAYSPRITQVYTKTQNKNFSADELDIQDEFDSIVEPKEGQTKVYAVPRIRKCQSRCLIDMCNLFGNMEGYDLMLRAMDDEELDFDILSAFMKIVGSSWVIFHKEFIKVIALQFT